MSNVFQLSKEESLGVLAMKYRSTRKDDVNARDQIALAYSVIVKELIESGQWKEIPSLEDQLPDLRMPEIFFDYWSLSPKVKKDRKKINEAKHGKNRHKIHRKRLAKARANRIAKKEFCYSRYGISGNYKPRSLGFHFKLSRFNEIEKEQPCVAKWARKLMAHGWKETSKGWRHGKGASLSILDAISTLNRSLHEGRIQAEAAIPAFLEEKGWVCTGPNKDVWMIKNWEKAEGFCYRTLKQAYKIQLGLK